MTGIHWRKFAPAKSSLARARSIPDDGLRPGRVRILLGCLGILAAAGCAAKPRPSNAGFDPFGKEFVAACPIDGPMFIRVNRDTMFIHDNPDTSFHLDLPFSHRSQDSLFYSGMGFLGRRDAQGRTHYFFIDCERCNDWSDALQLEVIPRSEFRPERKYRMGGEENIRTCE